MRGNTYADSSNEDLLEVMDDHGDAHEVIHEAANRLRASLASVDALAEVCKAFVSEARSGVASDEYGCHCMYCRYSSKSYCESPEHDLGCPITVARKLLSICTGCRWHDSKTASTPLGPERRHFCKHPKVYFETSGLETDTQRYIGDTEATPSWCPILISAAAGPEASGNSGGNL